MHTPTFLRIAAGTGALAAAILVLCGCARRDTAIVVTYPAPAGVAAAPDMSIEVNGQPVFAYDYPLAAVAYFSFSGTARIAVTLEDVDAVRFAEEHEHVLMGQVIRPDPLTSKISKVDVRPLKLGVKPQVRGSTIEFELSGPANLSVEINNNLRRPLFLFANALEKGAPRPGDPGVRYFEGGKIHEVGLLELRSNETVYIAGGAVVRGLVAGDGVQDVKVIGRGILERPRGESKVISPLQGYLGLRRAKNVLLEGFSILNNGDWTLVPALSDNIQIENVKVISWPSDGIDLVGSRHVRINHSFIRADDDCIAIKSFDRTRTPVALDARKDPYKDVFDVQVTDSVLWNETGGNALEIGFELRTPSIREIVYRNIDILHVRRGGAMTIHNTDWTTVSNVLYEDIRVEDIRSDELIDISITLSRHSEDTPPRFDSRGPDRVSHVGFEGLVPGDQYRQNWTLSEEEMRRHATNRGWIRDIVFRNIEVNGDYFNPLSFVIGYDDQHMVENVTIDNLRVHGVRVKDGDDGRFVVSKTKNLRFVAE